MWYEKYASHIVKKKVFTLLIKEEYIFIKYLGMSWRHLVTELIDIQIIQI